MTNFIPVKVICHSGYKAEEYPKSFQLENNEYQITDISDRWYQSDYNPDWPVSDYFKVTTDCGKQFILKHEIESDNWYLYR